MFMKKLFNKIELKPLLIATGLIAFQSIIFFGVKLFQNNFNTIGNHIDELIPFNYLAIIPYYIWYFMIFYIPYYLYQKDKDMLSKYLLSYIVCVLVADLIFLVYPSMVVRPEIEVKGVLSFLTKVIYWVDNPPINCFPSMHCAVSMLFILTVCNSKNISNRFKVITTIISILIMISTLVIKQHVFIDLVSGDIIMTLIYITFSKNKKLLLYVKKVLKI